jgi:septum formation protein
MVAMTERDLPIILASESPRRRDILTMLGIRFEVDPSGIDEPLPPTHERPGDLVRDASLAKARSVGHRRPGRIVIAADTVVTMDGFILGKPADPLDAARMLRQLAGRSNVVYSGVAIVAADGREGADWESTRVEMAPMSEPEIGWYVASGEPLGKAGAYAIQGLGARFIRRIDGCYYTVVGLPVYKMISLARDLGIALRAGGE